MVNCNPETVSTDYDTSDRLYFEPLRLEEVLAVCEREQPIGVTVQFGGQTPLKLARGLEDAGFRIIGTPFDAVDIAEDRERFAALLERLGIRCPAWGIARTAAEARQVAEQIGFPVLIRPSYVLGGRAMRVCYSADELGTVDRPVLIDRFVEGAIEIDVDAVSDGTETYIGAVMQHVEEAGVHSGDSACVLPAPSLGKAQDTEIRDIVRTLAGALGVVGLLNVQLAVVDGATYVLEANPRASRTIPFASKATGVNLVQAACRVMAGARVSELDLSEGQSLGHVSVKAAVLPFARFPGADPVLGPEMRSTGEVMASAADLPTAFAKAERAAGRPLPLGGTAFLSVRDADKPRGRARRRPPRGARLRAAGHDRHRGRARRRRAHRGARPQGHRRRNRGDRGRPHPTRPLQPRRQHAPRIGRAYGRLPDPGSSTRGAGALHHDAVRRSRRCGRNRERPHRGIPLPAGADRP